MGPSKAPTKAEREWMALIADDGCVACRKDGHHSPASVHFSKRTFVARYGSELDLLAELQARLK